MWYIGQKVVCVSDVWLADPAINESFPVKDNVYTIAEIRHVGKKFYPFGFIFFELNNPYCYKNEVTGELKPVNFNSLNFRPLLDKKTDITVFTDILKNVKEPEIV